MNEQKDTMNGDPWKRGLWRLKIRWRFDQKTEIESKGKPDDIEEESIRIDNDGGVSFETNDKYMYLYKNSYFTVYNVKMSH